MKIRILQNFSCYEVGQVFEDWAEGMCEVLVGRGLIEPVKDAEEHDIPAKVPRKKVK